MKVTFAHICDYALVAQDGKLSVIGIFSGIGAPALPVTHPSMFLAFEIELNYAEARRGGKLRIELVDEDGEGILSVDAELKYEGPTKIGMNPRLAQVIGFQQTRFPRFGSYNLNFFCNDVLDRQMEFRVQQATPPQPPARPAR